MFQYVNEVAVIGISFFMMAIATLWYSEYLFQKAWRTAVKLSKSDLSEETQYMKRNMCITFCSYVIVVYLIAGVIGYAQVYGFPVEKIALLMALGFAALLAGITVWERRPLSYFGITAGFSTVFIVGSSYLLYNWPW